MRTVYILWLTLVTRNIAEWEAFGRTFCFKESKTQLCGAAKFCFNPEQTVYLKDIFFQKHSTNLNDFLIFEKDMCELVVFQKAMVIDTINKEILSIDRRTPLFWEQPLLGQKD